MGFEPDYRNILDAAMNRKPKRLPVYEHLVNLGKIEEITGKKIGHLYSGDFNDKKEFFRQYCNFFRDLGYDTVSYEECIGAVMPGSGALGRHKPGVIKNMDDFNKYPWADIPKIYEEKCFPAFEALESVMPSGMKGIGGAGNGVFECVQDVVGYMDLCYISVDDPELYACLFKAVGNVMDEIWRRFLNRFKDLYTVCRFGDDLGYKTQTLLSVEDIKTHIIPQYKKVVERIHSYSKPFLLHSCGNIFAVMDDLINIVKIDAKHSNEDVIAPFGVWIQKYGDKIANFGGVDTDILSSRNEKEIKEYTLNVIKEGEKTTGFALGSGNSIPEYVSTSGYFAMLETVREYRGDKV